MTYKPSIREKHGKTVGCEGTGKPIFPAGATGGAANRCSRPVWSTESTGQVAVQFTLCEHVLNWYL